MNRADTLTLLRGGNIPPIGRWPKCARCGEVAVTRRATAYHGIANLCAHCDRFATNPSRS